MHTEIKVTYIVPMYNVEQYIEKCVNSIRKQTVENIEILLINDGSPDSSLELANKLAKTDDRITVFDKENGGVSSARNLGVEKAKGEFIVFVDGDDHLDVTYTEYMLMLSEKSGADFVMSTRCCIYPKEFESSGDDDFEIWDREKAIYELLYPGRINIGCWNKMFNRDFLIRNKIEFLLDLYMGEGLNFIIKAANAADKIVVGNKKLYYYRKDNSNSATTVINVPKFINAIEALDRLKYDSLINSSKVGEAWFAHKYLATFYAYRAIQITDNISKYRVQYNQYKKSLLSGLFKLFSFNIPNKIKVKIALLSLFPFLNYTRKNSKIKS